MTRILVLGAALLALGGCVGHQELKSPCEPLASLDPLDGCGPERSINVASLGLDAGRTGAS